jgi:hypothetical protein
LVSPARRLVKQGILTVGLFEHQVYLFSDLLLITKKKIIASGGYTHALKVSIPLKHALMVQEKGIFVAHWYLLVARSFFIKYKSDSFHFVAPEDLVGQEWALEISSVIKSQKARVMSLDIV